MLALIAGAVATIAEAPQILVPTATSAAIFAETLILLLKYITIRIADIRQIKIIGRAVIPKFIISPRPRRIPRQIIPNLKIFFILKSIPELKAFGKFIILPIINPIIMASIIDEIGLLSNPIISVPIYSLLKIPIQAIKMLKPTPGNKLIKLSFIFNYYNP